MNLATKSIGLVVRFVPRRLALSAFGFPLLARAVTILLNTILAEGLQEVGVASGPIAGSRLRVDIKKHKYFWLGTYEPWVQEAILRYLQPGMNAWDVGAFIGYHTLLMRRVAGPGRIVALEPDPVNRANLEYHLALNGADDVAVLPMAAGAFRGRARLELVPGGPSQTKAVRCEGGQCEMDTLDSLLERFPAPKVVKMDIEGGEADALAGAARLLEETRPVWILELHGLAGQYSVERLRKAGYAVARVGRWVKAASNFWGGGAEHVVAFPVIPTAS